MDGPRSCSFRGNVTTLSHTVTVDDVDAGRIAVKLTHSLPENGGCEAACQHIILIHSALCVRFSLATLTTMSTRFNELDLSDNDMDGDYEYQHEGDEDVMEEDEDEFTDQDEEQEANPEEQEEIFRGMRLL